MADEATPTGETTEATPTGETTETTSTETNNATVDYEAESAKWKSLARKHEKQAKENADAAKKLQDIEDANKTESQKLQDKAAEADKRAAEAEARALRLEVASEKGLTPKQAKRLVGNTREELEADADELLDTFGSATDKKDTTERRPKERLKPGATPNSEPEELDPKKLAANVPTGY